MSLTFSSGMLRVMALVAVAAASFALWMLVAPAHRADAQPPRNKPMDTRSYTSSTPGSVTT